MISKYRPVNPIIACSTNPSVCRQLNMSWGVVPLLVDEKKDTSELLDHAVDMAEEKGLVFQGDLVVLTSGYPLGIAGTTNMMKVHLVGHVILSGTSVTTSAVCANLCVCKDEKEVAANFKDGDIIVVPYTTNAMMPYIRKSSGIITEQTGLTSHASVIGLSLDLPVIVGADNATKILKSGTVVTLDAARGIVVYK